MTLLLPALLCCLDQLFAAGTLAGLVADHLAATGIAGTGMFSSQLGRLRFAVNNEARHLICDADDCDLDQVIPAAAFAGL